MVDTWAPLRYVARMFWELAISSTGGRSTGSVDGEEGQCSKGPEDLSGHSPSGNNTEGT